MSRIQTSIDLEHAGRQYGDLLIKWSDNRRPLGAYPIPIICLAQGQGPTVLLTGGVHGDEFEGPAALMRLAQDLNLDELSGRVIIAPALNAMAVAESSRVSPLDRLNLNRAFPGNADGSPTQMLAHYLETVLIPRCDAVIDLHSGGQASIFAPCALTQLEPASELTRGNLGLAQAFAAPYVWVASAHNDDRSLNGAAERCRVPMIAAELGGGGGCDPKLTGFAESALKRCLHHLGILDGAPAAAAEKSRYVEIEQSFLAPASGLFDREFELGDTVEAGQSAGRMHYVDDPARPSMELRFPGAGIVLAHANRGMLERGDLIALLATPSDIENRLA